MADLTSAGAAIMSVISPELVDSTFLNKDIFNLPVNGPQPTQASGAHRWVALTVANASGGTANPDGGPFPAAGSNTLAQASLTPQLFDAAMRVTDEVDAALQKGADAVGVMALETQKMFDKVYDNFSAMVLSTTAPLGIELAIDSSGTYAGISHGATGWGSRETNVGGALTAAVLYADEEALMLPDRACSQSDLVSLCSPEQFQNYLQLGGLGNATITNSPIRVMAGSNEAVNVNIGANRSSAQFGLQQIIPVRDMTNTIWLMGERKGIEILYHDRSDAVRGLKVEDAPRSGYERKVVASWYGIFKIANPYKWAKDTSVTA